MHVSSSTASPSLHLPHTAPTVRFQFDLWPVEHTGTYGYHPFQHYCVLHTHTFYVFLMMMTAVISVYGFKLLEFIMQANCVLCEVLNF
jgi:hypothetical protein